MMMMRTRMNNWQRPMMVLLKIVMRKLTKQRDEFKVKHFRQFRHTVFPSYRSPDSACLSISIKNSFFKV